MDKPKKHGAVTGATNILANQREKEKNEILSADIKIIQVKDIIDFKLEDGTVMFNRLSCGKIKIAELAENILEMRKAGAGINGTGFLQPILVRKKGDKFERIFGLSRITAAIKNHINEIPAIVVETLTDDLARFIRSSENLNREDLNPYDEIFSVLEQITLSCGFKDHDSTKSFLYKIKNFCANKTTLTEKEEKLYSEVSSVFDKLGRYEVRTFADKLPILKIHNLIKEALVSGDITYNHAKVIRSKAGNNDDLIKEAIEKVKRNNYSVKSLKEYFKGILEEKKPDQEKIPLKKRPYDYLQLISKAKKKTFSKFKEDEIELFSQYTEKLEKIIKEVENRIV